MFDKPTVKRELLKLADLLNAKAQTAVAAAAEFKKHGEIDNSIQEMKRAENARYYAEVCKKAEQFLSRQKACRGPSKTRDSQDSEAFSTFWTAYPRKENKGEARRAWMAMRCEEISQKIMDGLARAKQSAAWLKERGNFIPHPSTWLRAEGWEDVHTSAATESKPERYQDPKGWKEFLAANPEYPKKEFRSCPPWMRTEFTLLKP